MSEKKGLSGLITVFLISIVGLALTPTVQANVTLLTETGLGKGNLTGSAKAIMELFPMFWVILMISIPVAYIAVWLRG